MPRKKKPVKPEEEDEGPISYIQLPGGLLASLRGVPPPISYRLGRLEAKSKPPAIDAAKLDVLKKAETRRVCRRAPDRIEVITAWRAWDVTVSDGSWRLEGLGSSAVWPPRKQMDAACRQDSFALMPLFASGSRSPRHPAPHWDCSCGVWAFKDLDILTAAVTQYSDIRVLGTVALWGRVIETENGYRAQYAYPSELWLFDNSLEELGLIYDVPVRVVD